MPQWIHRLTPLVLSLLVAGTAYADNQAEVKKTIAPIQSKIKLVKENSSSKDQASLQRNLSLAQRTNDIFTLLASELINIQGKSEVALATDLKILNRTQDPNLAQRSMEIALADNNIAAAEEIAQILQKIDPKDSQTKQRLLWELALAKNDEPQLIKYTDSVLSSANEYQLKRLFLLLAQYRLKNLYASDQLNKHIHKTASKHPELAEAMIVDAIYGVTGNHKAQTINALKRLSELDNDILPPTQLTLNLINIKQPQYLNEFYQQVGINNLPSRWQSLYIEIQIKNQNLQEAYLTLQPLLAKSKSADLYIQAMYLAISQQEPSDTIIEYATKAVELGNENQRSKAAMLVAMRYFDEHNYAASRTWLTQVTDGYYKFDKAILLASIESEAKNWAQARKWLDLAATISGEPTFYDTSDLVRLKTYINSSSLTPKQYEIQLTKEINIAEQSSPKLREINLPPLLYLRGLLYADKLHKPEKAVQDLRRYRALRPDLIEGYNALGYTLLSLPKNHWQEAQELLEKAYAMDDESPAVNDSLGWAYHLNGESKKALPLLEFAFEHQPESEVAAHLGEVYWQLGQKELARQTWASGLSNKNSDQYVLMQILHQHKINPKSLSISQQQDTDNQADNQKLLYKIFNDYTNDVAKDTFIRDLNQLMQTGSELEKETAALLAGLWFVKRGDTAESLEWLDKVHLEKFQTDKAYVMSLVSLEKGDYSAAEKWFRQVSDKSESLILFNKYDFTALSAEIYKNTMPAQAYIQQLNDMLAQAKKDGEDDSIVALIIFQRATAYSGKLNQYKKAIPDYRTYIQLRPDDAFGWNDLGYTLLSMPKKHWAEALSILQHAYELDSRSIEIKDSLGWAYYLNGNPIKAITFLRSAFNESRHSTAAAHLGEVLWQQDRRDEARQIWAEGLKDQEHDKQTLEQTLKKFGVNPQDLVK